MKLLLLLLVATLYATEPGPTKDEEAEQLRLDRSAAYDQIALGNAMMAQMQAGRKAEVSQQTAQAHRDELARRYNCEIDPGPVKCKAKPEAPTKEKRQ